MVVPSPSVIEVRAPKWSYPKLTEGVPSLTKLHPWLNHLANHEEWVSSKIINIRKETAVERTIAIRNEMPNIIATWNIRIVAEAARMALIGGRLLLGCLTILVL